MHLDYCRKYNLFTILGIKKHSILFRLMWMWSVSPWICDSWVFTISLSDLEKFISVVETGLSQRVEEGDYTGLVEVMGHLLAVKERQSSTDAMFEPLQHTIALLKVYEQELPDVVYKQLEVNCRSSTSHSFFFLPPGPFSLSWDRLITFSLCLPIPHLLSVLLLLAIHHLSLLSASHFSPSIHLPIAVSNVLSDRCPQELPEKWNSVRKQAAVVKQKVAPLQATEVVSLRRKCAAFDVEQHTFREHFRNNGPFRYKTTKNLI